jgi:hypothetical protein
LSTESKIITCTCGSKDQEHDFLGCLPDIGLQDLKKIKDFTCVKLGDKIIYGQLTKGGATLIGKSLDDRK